MSTSSKPREVPVAVAADRATIRLSDDSSLLDFESSGFGHGAAKVVKAVVEQTRINPLATRHFLSLPLAKFSALLADICPGDLGVSYLCNSGAEAVEGALKLAHGFHRNRGRFVALEGSYHGSTLGALSVCGVEEMRTPFTRLPLHATFAANLDQAEALVDRGTAAMIVEPWPGDTEGPAQAGWLRRLSSRCAAVGALLIADETRSGIGRTGAMFAVEHERVVPDVLVVGGALGGGILPVAGYVTNQRVNDRVYGRRDPTLHASATGGNPAACAAGMATLRMIEDDDLLVKARIKGGFLLTGLDKLASRHSDIIADTRSAGLFARIEFYDRADADAVADAAFERGLACRLDLGRRSAGIELYPPILVDEDEIGLALEILDDAVAAVASRQVLA